MRVLRWRSTTFPLCQARSWNMRFYGLAPAFRMGDELKSLNSMISYNRGGRREGRVRRERVVFFFFFGGGGGFGCGREIVVLS